MGIKRPQNYARVSFRDGDFVKFMRWKAFWSERLNPDGSLGDITSYHRQNFNKSLMSDFEDVEWS